MSGIAHTLTRAVSRTPTTSPRAAEGPAAAWRTEHLDALPSTKSANLERELFMAEILAELAESVAALESPPEAPAKATPHKAAK